MRRRLQGRVRDARRKNAGWRHEGRAHVGDRKRSRAVPRDDRRDRQGNQPRAAPGAGGPRGADGGADWRQRADWRRRGGARTRNTRQPHRAHGCRHSCPGRTCAESGSAAADVPRARGAVSEGVTTGRPSGGRVHAGRLQRGGGLTDRQQCAAEVQWRGARRQQRSHDPRRGQGRVRPDRLLRRRLWRSPNQGLHVQGHPEPRLGTRRDRPELQAGPHRSALLFVEHGRRRLQPRQHAGHCRRCLLLPRPRLHSRQADLHAGVVQSDGGMADSGDGQPRLRFHRRTAGPMCCRWAAMPATVPAFSS